MSVRVYGTAGGGDWGVAFEAILDDIGREGADELFDRIDDVSDETLALLKSTSPRGRSRKHYWRGWKKTKIRLDKGLGGILVTLHNDSKPTLTHLLEDGHRVVRGGPLVLGGVVVGKARAFPHIEKAEKHALARILRGL